MATVPAPRGGAKRLDTGRERTLSGFRLAVDGGYFLRAVTGRLGKCSRPLTPRQQSQRRHVP